jgi:hypothetical protein
MGETARRLKRGHERRSSPGRIKLTAKRPIHGNHIKDQRPSPYFVIASAHIPPDSLFCALIPTTNGRNVPHAGFRPVLWASRPGPVRTSTSQISSPHRPDFDGYGGVSNMAHFAVHGSLVGCYCAHQQEDGSRVDVPGDNVDCSWCGAGFDAELPVSVMLRSFKLMTRRLRRMIGIGRGGGCGRALFWLRGLGPG